jgi:hypothetical protein
VIRLQRYRGQIEQENEEGVNKEGKKKGQVERLGREEVSKDEN